jgi:phage tail P2-like protein
MSELLPPNATALERRVAITNARVTGIPVHIDSLMSADEVPLPFLPWLAWHLSVTSWKDSWPEETKRSRLETAIRIARIRGTATAVRQVCESFGANVVMREWFETTPRGKPGTFEIAMTAGTADGAPVTAECVAAIIDDVNAVKRGTAHFLFKQELSMLGRPGVGAAVRVAVHGRLNLTDR